jgi:hypothetical protein
MLWLAGESRFWISSQPDRRIFDSRSREFGSLLSSITELKFS